MRRPQGSPRGENESNRAEKESSVAQVRSALVFTRSGALAEYGGSPELHYFVMEGRNPSALSLLSDRETRLSVGEELANLASRCDRGNTLSKAAGRKLLASRTRLLSAFEPTPGIQRRPGGDHRAARDQASERAESPWQ
jgi:hypothetical protein